MAYVYKHPRPAATADAVVLGYAGEELQVILVQRRAAPYKSWWALPGGFVGIEESPERAARRELAEEAEVTGVRLRQLGTFGEPGRDPRDRVISVAYLGVCRLTDHPVKAADDAKAVGWFSLTRLPRLAFDHRRIIAAARDRLRVEAEFGLFFLMLLPAKFPLRDVRLLLETLLGRAHARKRITALRQAGILVPSDISEARSRSINREIWQVDSKWTRQCRPLL